MTAEVVLAALVALLAIVVLSATLLRRALGFVAAAVWSLFPVYGALLPPGGGLLALTGGLVVLAAIAHTRERDRPSTTPMLALSALLAAIIVVREWIESTPAENATGLQLAASVVAAALLGRIGSLVRWRQGFALGLLPGGVVLAIAETVRVLGGGGVHAQQAALGVNPIVLAQYVAVAALVVVFQVVRGAWRWYAWAVFLVAVAGLVASGSRGPLLGLVVAVSFTLLRGHGVERAHVRRTIRVIVVVLLGALLVAVLAVWRIDVAAWLRIDDADGNASSRLTAWQAAVATIAQHPLVGAGPGRYFRSGYGIDAGAPAYPHNLWLEAWAEYGLIPMLLLIAVVVVAWRRSAQLGQVFVIFAVVSYGLSGSFDTSLVLWMCLSIAVSTRVLDRRPDAESVVGSVAPPVRARASA